MAARAPLPRNPRRDSAGAPRRLHGQAPPAEEGTPVQPVRGHAYHAAQARRALGISAEPRLADVPFPIIHAALGVAACAVAVALRPGAVGLSGSVIGVAALCTVTGLVLAAYDRLVYPARPPAGGGVDRPPGGGARRLLPRPRRHPRPPDPAGRGRDHGGRLRGVAPPRRPARRRSGGLGGPLPARCRLDRGAGARPARRGQPEPSPRPPGRGGPGRGRPGHPRRPRSPSAPGAATPSPWRPSPPSWSPGRWCWWTGRWSRPGSWPR